jgi:Trk K+ transport system NAD-binding subunit
VALIGCSARSTVALGAGTHGSPTLSAAHVQSCDSASAAPERGAANAAVVTAVAEWLQVPRCEVRVRSGRSGRTKLIEVVAEITLPAPDASFT